MPPDGLRLNDVVASAWPTLWRDIGARGDPDAVLGDLLARYAEPHRRYHTIDAHIAPGLRLLDDPALPLDDAPAVRWAFWFHDAVYDPRASDNEERSADLAAARARDAGIDGARADCIAALVLATRHPPPAPLTGDAAAIADVDLAVLGAPPDEFDAYERGIRVEYAFVPDDRFRAGRAAFLRRLLDARHIFSTPFMRDRFESAARANIARSLAHLDAGRLP